MSQHHYRLPKDTNPSSLSQLRRIFCYRPCQRYWGSSYSSDYEAYEVKIE